MLSRFQCIITRDTLKADLENKHMVLFTHFCFTEMQIEPSVAGDFPELWS